MRHSAQQKKLFPAPAAPPEKQRFKCPVHIRWMIRRDMEAVLRIEAACFKFPWTLEEFIRCLRQRNCIGQVAENSADQVIGFYVYELKKTGVEVFNFAVDPDYWGCGVGSQLVEKLKGKLSSCHRRWIQLVIQETNLPAAVFFRDHGFQCEKVLHGFFRDVDSDGYRMVFYVAAAAAEKSVAGPKKE